MNLRTAHRILSGRRRKWPWISVVGLMMLALLWFLAGPTLAWSNVEKVNITSMLPADANSRSYVLVGADTRSGLSQAERERLGATGPETNNADSIVLLRVGSVGSTMVSLPRDAIVETEDLGRVRLALMYKYHGAQGVVSAVEQATGVHIDGYVQVGLGGLEKLVNSVGGVTVCPKVGLDDHDAGVKIDAGCQAVDGRTALGYARSRKSDGLGDLGRAMRQREVLGELSDKVLSVATLANPNQYWDISRAVGDAVTVSDGFGVGSGVKILAGLRSASTNGRSCAATLNALKSGWSTDAEKLFAAVRSSDGVVPRELCPQA